MKVLVTDLLFPNKYSRWRNVEICSFIRKYEADILAFKADSYAGIRFDFDIEHEIYDSLLTDYNILIFESRYNHLNKYNKNIDGTKFNNRYPGSYLLTKNTDFDIDRYDCIYHIFLMIYRKFNSTYKINQNKQIIHLYPGGGLLKPNDASSIDHRARIVSTHPLVTSCIRDNKYIEALMGTILNEDERVYTNHSKQSFGVCFSSLGSGLDKGEESYIKVVHQYKRLYGEDEVKFFSVGNCSESPHITHLSPMDYKSLGKFYKGSIDVYINLESGNHFSGFPLGIEAAIEGSVIITTDVHNSKKQYRMPDDCFLITHSVDEAVSYIKQLYDNRNLLMKFSMNTSDYLNQVISYENQQKRIFKFIES